MAAGARAKARAERERLAALAATERARRAERERRRRAFVARVIRWVPRRRGPAGVLAARRRTQVRTTVAVLVVLNVVVWLVSPEWSARLGALVASVLVGPVLHTMLFRRR